MTEVKTNYEFVWVSGTSQQTLALIRDIIAESCVEGNDIEGIAVHNVFVFLAITGRNSEDVNEVTQFSSLA